MRYGTLVIGSIDQNYLDKLSDTYDIDYYDCEIYIDDNNTTTANITNQLFHYVLSEAVNKLELESKEKDSIKEYITERIYCNCLDSGFDTNTADIESKFKISTEDRIAIQNLLD